MRNAYEEILNNRVRRMKRKKEEINDVERRGMEIANKSKGLQQMTRRKIEKE